MESQQKSKTKKTSAGGLSDPRDQNDEQYNSLFNGPEHGKTLSNNPQPMTPPYKAPKK